MSQTLLAKWTSYLEPYALIGHVRFQLGGRMGDHLLYHIVPCFITANKRKGKDKAYEIVYIISNKDVTPKKQVKSYEQRWAAEKFFRTAKQSLGLRDCQSTNQSKHELHFYCIMVGYTLLHHQKNYSRQRSIEEVLTVLRHQKTTPKFYRYIDSMLTFM